MQVYYFTRTGKCKNLAEQIASKNNVSANKIDDGKDWSGAAKFIHAGASAAKNTSLPIKHEPFIKGESAVVVFPLWAGTMPPAVRTFMEENKGENIIAVVSSAATSINAKDVPLFTKVYEVKGKDTQAPEI